MSDKKTPFCAAFPHLPNFSYLGIEGVRPYRVGNWDCPVFVMLPLNWGAIYRGLFDG